MTSIADIRAAVLAAGALPPYGTSTLAGQTVTIRAMTGSEETAYLSESLAKGMIPICAACIVDGLGAPVFTKEELGAMRAGMLKQVYADILKLTFPSPKELGNGSGTTQDTASDSD